MITFKRVEAKTETRTLKHTDYVWSYKLHYIARYQDNNLTSISKAERKFYNTSKGVKGGWYRKSIIKNSNVWIQAKILIETLGKLEVDA